MLRMIGYMNLVYEGGQKDDFIEALQKLYRNRQKKVVSCVNGCLTRYDAVFHGSILYKALIEMSLNHQLFHEISKGHER